jgi:alkylation response protein AidB-like acyl-CoA dehydrogenase
MYLAPWKKLPSPATARAAMRQRKKPCCAMPACCAWRSREHGGDALSWPDIYRHIRALAAVDSALAHVLAFHQLQVATVLIYGSRQQRRLAAPHHRRERLVGQCAEPARHASAGPARSSELPAAMCSTV